MDDVPGQSVETSSEIFQTPTQPVSTNRTTNVTTRTPSQDLSLNHIQKVSLVRLSSLDDSEESPLSPTTLAKLVEEQTKSHEAIEALQQRILSDTPVSYTSEVRKELEQSALEQRQYLNQVLSTPSNFQSSTPESQQQSTMLAVSSNINNLTPLAKRLFPNGLNDVNDDVTRSSCTEHKHSLRKDYFPKRLDTDNDTGVESDSSSDNGGETSGRRDNLRDFKPAGGIQECDDLLLLYLEAIERKALEMDSVIEKAKLDTVLKIKHQMEAEFCGVALDEIPAKCHEKIDRAIQRYLTRELDTIKAQCQETGAGDKTSPRGFTTDLQHQNRALTEEVKDLEATVSRLDATCSTQNIQNEHLSDRITRLERQLANQKLRYEAELDDMKLTYEEDMDSELREGRSNFEENPQKLASLYEKLEREENLNKALKIANEADQTTIKCLEFKVSDIEQQFSNSRARVNDLLNEIHELKEREEQKSDKLKRYETQLKVVSDEKRLLKETLIMSEHEIRLLEEKLDHDNSSAWKESKVEILEDLRKLEKHIRTIHREKRKLETKFLAFKIENENLTDSIHLLNHSITPLESRDVSCRASNLSSHSSSRTSSLAGSDVEDEVQAVRKHHSGGRRRKRGQDYKDKLFAEAVSKKLIFAQKAMKDENCNFSSFDNSGKDLFNEADKLVKRVENLQAEKLAIKKELESVRTGTT